jgi:parallel beta-helix repeat protein
MKRRKTAYFFVGLLCISLAVQATSQGDCSHEYLPQDTSYMNYSENDEFGPPQDAMSLGLKGYPQPLRNQDDVITQNITFCFSPSDCTIQQYNTLGMYVGLKNLEPSGLPGEPMLPMKTYRITLPLNSELLTVGITSASYRELKNKITIAPFPEPQLWDNAMTQDIGINYDVYSLNSYFPGSFCSYDAGFDDRHHVVFLHVYPFQYHPRQHKAILLTEGELIVQYRFTTPSSSIHDLSVVTAENIIVTAPALYASAQLLKQFHEAEGTSTAIVNTTWIYDSYAPSDDPPYNGYKDATMTGKNLIHGYNYTLAKKIISFLNATDAHPHLKFVTILGNARMVPPSYYFDYNCLPTDFFYASPDLDIVPNFRIGRLPVNDSLQADHLIQKIMNWRGATDLFGKVTVAGGKPFETAFDIGELISVDSINRGYFRGIKPVKCFQTDNTFNKDNLTRALQGDTGLLFWICHGSGDAWYLIEDPLNTTDVMSLSSNDQTPIVLSIACGNGAYDTHLYDLGFTISAGESILLSDAGGIAYIGGARSNAGTPIFSLENGNLKIEKESYMAGMLLFTLKAYNDGDTALGDLTFHATQTYLSHNDLTYIPDLYAYFSLVLLGDPALQLPQRPTGKEFKQPELSMETPALSIDAVRFDRSISPSMTGSLPLCSIQQDVTLQIDTDSPLIDMKLVDAQAFYNATKKTGTIPVIDNIADYEFTTKDSSLYSIRAATQDGKEGWLYTALARIVDDDIDEVWQDYRWNSIQDAIDESEDNDIIAVVQGTYNETIVMDKPLILLGEDAELVELLAQQKEPVILIDADNCMLSGFHLVNHQDITQTMGIHVDANDSFISYNNVSNFERGLSITSPFSTILQYNTFSENVYAVSCDHAGMSFIFVNTMYNNEYGISIKQSNQLYVFCNIIRENNRGIYLDFSELCFIINNNITDNHLGMYLEKSNKNSINNNNFIRNERHASFMQSRIINWLQNYWDTYLWNNKDLPITLPKIIPGKLGLQGLIPWFQFDFFPSKTPYPNLFEL